MCEHSAVGHFTLSPKLSSLAMQPRSSSRLYSRTDLESTAPGLGARACSQLGGVCPAGKHPLQVGLPHGMDTTTHRSLSNPPRAEYIDSVDIMNRSLRENAASALPHGAALG